LNREGTKVETLVSTNEFSKVIAEIEDLMKELEAALAHSRTARDHYGAADVPRACAHLWAMQGHLTLAERRAAGLAQLHAGKAKP
jgi:hypothetical protein